MGAVYFGLDPELVRFFTSHLPLRWFVETGTHEGDTLADVAELFETVYSVEVSPRLFEKARKRFSDQPGVHLHCGDSAEFIRERGREWSGSATLYWLDAHWCDTSGGAPAERPCPLLGELESIGRLGEDSVVVIDDARLLLSSPPQREHGGQWPDLDAVLEGLGGLSAGHALAVVNDTFVVFPKRLRKEFDAFCRQHGRDVLGAWDKARGYDALLQQLREKEALIGEQARQLSEKQSAVAAMSEQLKEKEACIEEQERQLQERDRDLLARQLREKEALIGELRAELDARDGVISEMSRALEERQALSEGLERRLQAKETRLRRLEKRGSEDEGPP